MVKIDHQTGSWYLIHSFSTQNVVSFLTGEIRGSLCAANANIDSLVNGNIYRVLSNQESLFDTDFILKSK